MSTLEFDRAEEMISLGTEYLLINRYSVPVFKKLVLCPRFQEVSAG